MEFELPLIGAPHRQHTGELKAWGEQKDPEEMDWRLNNSKECGSGREKSETNPPNPPLPLHRQEDQQN